MDASLSTIVHRFRISQGTLQDDPPSVLVVEGTPGVGTRYHRGNLYVLVEVLGGLPDPDDVVRRLAGVIRREYYRATASVTGGINAGLRAANDLLFEENLSSPREQRGVAGVSCAVVRDGDLYLGQMGPALAYLAQPDGLRRFPEESPWLRQAIPSDADRAAWPPLGVRRVVEPGFYHARVQPGDVLLLASPALARLAPSSAVAAALAAGGSAACERLRALAGAEDLTALVVTLAPEGGALPPAEEDEAEEDEAEEEGLLDLEEVPAEEQAWQPVARPSLRLGEALGRAGRELLSLLKSLLPERAPERHQARRLTQAVRPDQAPSPRPRRGGRLVATLTVLIPILALLLVVVGRHQYTRSRQLQVSTLLRQATEARDRGVQSGQKEVLYQELQRALAFADHALRLAPESPEALKLRQDVVDQLDVAGAVQRLYTLWELATFPPAGNTPAELTSVLVRGAEVFVLDRTGSRVYRRLLNPAGDALEPQTGDGLLVQRGEQRGAIAVGDLLDMVWMPAGGERKTAGLLILERNGSFLDWDVTRGLTVLPAANGATWKKPQALGAYSGNAYVLDTQQNRILKYVPTGGGYTQPPVDYLVSPSGVDLTTAVDMDIDGRVYVLLADGSVHRFLTGKPQPLRLADLDLPMGNPVALCVTGEDEAQGSLYVADAALARVVQFNKQGQFVRQFKAGEGKGELTRLRGLFVDEARQRIYLTSGPKLYVAPLPTGAGVAATATPGGGRQ